MSDILERFEFIIEEAYNDQRMDSFLGKILEEYSRSYVQKLISEGYVTLNGEAITVKKHKLKTGQILVIQIPVPEDLAVVPENIPIEIVYEDEDVIVVNKPQGMVVHPSPGNYNGTLVNAILYHATSLSSINGVIRPGIVHRIDKDTSGLLVIAKNNVAHAALSEQFKAHTITRLYNAVVMGCPKNDEGTVDKPIARCPHDRMKMAVVLGGRRAVTHYRVLERFNGYSLIECRLETGRTHQIRVHMASIGHPLLGDHVYNNIRVNKIKHDGQVLHARTIGFIHPTKGEYMEFTSELPKYYNEIIKKLRCI